MKDFKKLDREQMKNVKGGQPQPPQCQIGSLCTGVSAGGYLVNGQCTADCTCSVSSGGEFLSCGKV